ncbi:RNA polymerase sigma factor [Actinoplanes sp. SE50]|uniref:RNA polymerase sigma factor SigF n=1 Tax=unclassified Actinoplanes TaxID=2626549 RepID=UPI00023EC85C|nr:MULTISPECIES: RNA polymerase sigma factor SigF [unclassified Actinoplanes]AEV87058.1 RNA polymerase sigma factor rpoD [Actinoplanes sp. SE50/110]ATO85456.1 RNA polymerase sigma factor [Actinoplanes sp. SE50]SLM02868.1 RNA polymerase sigma factor [Actinoplanes sp. SE50/110]
MTVIVDTAARADASASTDRASELINAMAVLPAGHPSRPGLRERAIEAWLPLARHLSQRYANRGEPRDDLYQVAVMGLIKAVDRFETDRGVDFAGFAIPTIVGELKRYFRDKTWSVRVPRRLQELRLAITAANNTLSHTLGRAPTVTDIAGYLDVSEDEVIEGLEGARAYNSTSLSTPMSESGTELGDTLGGPDTGYEEVERRVMLGPAMAHLDEREQKIVTLRFYGNLTQQQIAEQIGISQMHVSRLLTKALAKLRRNLDGATR